MADHLVEQFPDPGQRPQRRDAFVVDRRRDARVHHQIAQCALFALRHAPPLVADGRLAGRRGDPRVHFGKRGDFVERNLQPIGEHVHDLSAQRVRGQRLQQRLRIEQRLRAPFRLVKLLTCRGLVQQELGQRHRPLHLFRKRIRPEFPHIAVRIVLRGQEQETDRPVVRGVRQARLQRAPRGAPAGRVAVETEDDRVRLPQQLLHVNRRARGAERRHRVRKAELRERDDVHVPLDDERVLVLANREPRLEQAVQLAALVEQRRLRRIQVFGLAAVQHPAAEADDLPLHVADREHDPLAEPVVAARDAVRVGLLADDHEARVDERIVAVVVERRLEVLPAVRRVAEPEAQRDLARQAAPLQVLDRVRRAAQLLAVIVTGGLHHVGQRGRDRFRRRGRRMAVARAAASAHRRRLVRHREPDRLRELLHRLGKREPRVLHQEADRGAMRAATEAVIELLRRADRKRRALLVVKRAQPHEVGAALLELHVPADHVDDVDAVQQILQERMRNHRWIDRKTCRPTRAAAAGAGRLNDARAPCRREVTSRAPP
ncbi:hypothetical protein Y025_5578 [Burkholderia pseudomallei TSV32]|nr:hypothetical protein Y025_5578 [Burkholderia pseudomallei TSV32]